MPSDLKSSFRFPERPGAYAIELGLGSETTISIGKLGRFRFPAGNYLYCGSALGSGGLAPRLNRHIFQLNHNQHWHIDYLRPHTTPLFAVTVLEGRHPVTTDSPCECQLVRLIERFLDASFPAPGFGAGDCRSGCPAHLLQISSTEGLPVLDSASFQQTLRDQFPSISDEERVDCIDLRRFFLPG